jgi:hypothetical protein
MRSAPPSRRPFFIANSADIGAWKVDVRFWEAVQATVGRTKVGRLLVCDDFGFNEAAGDSYGGEAARIAGRKEQTRTTLRSVFGVEAEIVPFFLEERHGEGTGGGARLIAETALCIENFLKRP